MADTQGKLGLSQYHMTKLMAAMKITLFWHVRYLESYFARRQCLVVPEFLHCTGKSRYKDLLKIPKILRIKNQFFLLMCNKSNLGINVNSEWLKLLLCQDLPVLRACCLHFQHFKRIKNWNSYDRKILKKTKSSKATL